MMATVGGESKCGHARSRVEVTQAQNKKPRIASIDVQSNGVSVKTASRKKAVRLEVVEEVKTRLDEILNDASENALFIDNDGEPLWGPVVLCDKITWEDFSQWLDVYEGEVRRWIFEPLPDDDKCGKVVIYSLPSRPHEKTAGKLLQMIQKRVQTAGNSVDLIDTIEVEASPRCKLGNRRGKEPDMSISPTGLVTNEVNVLDSGKGFPFPNIVIEVAYKNEPLNPHPGSQSVGFRDVVRNWLSAQTSVQVVIGIKIFTRRAPRRYRAIVAVRNSPAWEVEFGDDAGNGPITLDFPVALLYHGVPLPPELANVVDLTIDLIALRNYLNTIPL